LDRAVVSARWTGLQGTEPAKEGPDHVIRMTTQNVPAFQIEDHMPPPNELKFRVDFIYHDEIPDRIWTNTGSGFGKKQSNQVESFVGSGKPWNRAVAQIVSPNDSPDDKLRKIYARTRNPQS